MTNREFPDSRRPLVDPGAIRQGLTGAPGPVPPGVPPPIPDPLGPGDLGDDGTEPTDELTQSVYDIASLLFPGMPAAFFDAFVEAMIPYFGTQNAVALAMLEVRQDPRYAQWFPGNLLPDGSGNVAYDEASYLTAIAQFRADVQQVTGLSPDVFSGDLYSGLIAGFTSNDEFKARLEQLTNEVLIRSDAFRTYYSEQFGYEPSDAALIESVFTGTNAAFAREIATGTVGFEGQTRGFDIDLTLAGNLFDAGIRTQVAAADLFGDAAANVPLFGRLTERHNDPGDPFDLGVFLEAAVFDDQDTLRRMQRLVAQERSQFSGFRSLRERDGALVGLTEQ